MKTDTTGGENALPPIVTPPRTSESGKPRPSATPSPQKTETSDPKAASKDAVFEEASSKLSLSLGEGSAEKASDRSRSSEGEPLAQTSLSPGSGDSSLAPTGTDADLPAVSIPSDIRSAITTVISNDIDPEADVEVQLQTNAAVANELASEAEESITTEAGTPIRSNEADPEDEVISVSARAASALAAGVALVPFGAVALGTFANLADFLAPSVVDGIEDPLSRGAAAAAFSGVFLGLSASVTNAIGDDLAHMVTENRITPNEPEGDVSRGSQLWSATKNQTIPAFIGFSAAFVTANALDAESQVLADTDAHTDTVLLKLARATAGSVAYGLAKEAANSFSDHSLTRTEADTVLDNTRKLGDAIKRNVSSLPQAISAYTRPTEKGQATEFGNVLGAAFGFATFAAINGSITGALESTFGEETGNVVSEPSVQAAIATAAGVAGFVIADQLTRNIYANIMPVRTAPDANPGTNEDPAVVFDTLSEQTV